MSRRHPLGVAGLLAIALGCWLAAGPPGLAVTAAVALAWLLVPSVYAVGIAALGLATLSPSPISLPALLAVVAGSAGVLVGQNATPRHVATVGVAVVGLLSALWAIRRGTDELWLVAVGLVVVVAFLLYAVHRYELVRLGLVGGDPV